MAAGVQERTTNPLTFSFIASWSLCNYKFFVVLFGDGTSSARLQAVAQLYPFEWQTYVGNAFLVPLGLALLYVYAYPWVSRHALTKYRAAQVETANKLKEIEKRRVLDQAQVIELTRRHEKARAKLEDTISTQAKEIAELRAALDAAESESTPPTQSQDSTAKSLVPAVPQSAVHSTASQPDSVEELLNGLSKPPLMLLLELSDYADPVSGQVLAKNNKLNYSVALAELEQLKGFGLVTQIVSSVGNEIGWTLTEKGRDLAVLIHRTADESEK